MQNGSPAPNVTGRSTVVNFQFIVKVAMAQSVSTNPSRAKAPSFGQLAGPRASKFQPGGVRDRYGTVNVSMPEPKWFMSEDGASPERNSNRNASMPVPPSQVTRTL